MTTEQHYFSCADLPHDLCVSAERYRKYSPWVKEEEIPSLIEEDLKIAKELQNNLLSRLPEGSQKASWESDLISEEYLEEYFQDLERLVNWHEAKPKASSDDTNYNLLTADELINGDYYLIGDLIYLIGDLEWIDFGYDDELIARTPKYVQFDTGGDGGFGDQHGRFYAVESGTFGMMKASEIPKQEIERILTFFRDFQERFPKDTSGLGHFVKLENGDVYADELGHIWFGNREVVIDGNCMWDTTNNVGVGYLS